MGMGLGWVHLFFVADILSQVNLCLSIAAGILQVCNVCAQNSARHVSFLAYSPVQWTVAEYSIANLMHSMSHKLSHQIDACR